MWSIVQDVALQTVWERNCFSEEAGVQSQAVPGRGLDLIVARERQLSRCRP